MTESLPIKAVDLALATIAPYQRPDLELRLRQARDRLLDEHVRVLVVGEFKKGKSLLVNGLVSAPVCPVYDDVATAVPTIVQHAETPKVTLVRVFAASGSDGFGERQTERTDIAMEQLGSYVSEARDPTDEQRPNYVVVGIPRQILATGLELVDTPGVGGLTSVHGAATMAALPAADAVLLVSDASQEYTAPELEFLRQAAKVCPNVACVLTKTDLYTEWRRILDLDRSHLATAGIEAPLFAVSSTLRWHAVRATDEAANTESGYPDLVAYLHQRVVGQKDLLARRSTVHDVLAVTDQLAGSLRTEQTAQQNPDTVQELMGQLGAAQQRAAGLKERSARWQHTLNDGIADLNADIDHDLRDRLREITQLAEEEIEENGDPAKVWEPFSEWVQQQVASAVSANFLWATERARWLSMQVAEHFSADRAAILPTLHTQIPAAMGSLQAPTMRPSEPWGLGQQALTTLRGGYVGVLMFGMMGTMVGLSLINPFSIGAGILLGGKTLSDERRRMIVRRQSEAKTSVRRHIDSVIFQVGKDSRDMLRGVQRDLRDHFTEQAEQTNRSLLESLQAAERSVKTSTADRDRRLTEIAAELQQLETLQQRVGTLLPGPDTPVSPRPAVAAQRATPELDRGAGRHRAPEPVW